MTTTKEIKALGTFDIILNLHTDVTKIRIKVEAQEETLIIHIFPQHIIFFVIFYINKNNICYVPPLKY